MDALRIGKIRAVVIGASAGGITALLHILRPMPSNFALPIVIVLHVPNSRDSKLAEVFQYHLAMKVQQASDKEWIQPGIIYFAPAGYHLSIEKNFSFSLSCEEPESFARPSIDVLMQSAADAYGASLAGILLTGANHDGAAGLASITNLGGLTIAQDPREAETPVMPQTAIDLCRPTLILKLDEIHMTLLDVGKKYDR